MKDFIALMENKRVSKFFSGVDKLLNFQSERGPHSCNSATLQKANICLIRK